MLRTSKIIQAAFLFVCLIVLPIGHAGAKLLRQRFRSTPCQRRPRMRPFILIALLIAISLHPAAALAALEDLSKSKTLPLSELQMLTEKAEQGFANAQDNRGVMYANGQGVLQNYAEAMKWYRKAADQGLAAAQFGLGIMYYNGHGVAKDYAEAMKWYRKAADQGEVGAQYNLGVMYGRAEGVPQDYAEAINWYRKAAEKGFSYAQNNLGDFYEHGKGLPRDYSEAMKLYRQAAQQGYALAYCGIGDIYNHGEGVPQDYAEAAKWYRKGANGALPCIFDLGQLYAKGRGVPQDYEQAYAWLSAAADQGNKDAATIRDEVAKNLTPPSLLRAHQLSKQYLTDYANHPSGAAP